MFFVGGKLVGTYIHYMVSQSRHIFVTFFSTEKTMGRMPEIKWCKKKQKTTHTDSQNAKHQNTLYAVFSIIHIRL